MHTNSPGSAQALIIVLLAMALAGCEAIGTIFEAGIWVGVIMVVIVLGIVGLIASKLRRP